MTGRLVLVSACDGLAARACRGLWDGHGWRLVGLVRTRLGLAQRRRLLAAAVRHGALVYAAYAQAESLLPSLADRLAGRPALVARARAAGIPVHVSDDVNRPETLAWITARAPAAVLCVRPGHVLRRPTVAALAPILNLHCSLLPDYRGIGGILRPLADGRRRLGCSVHLIVDETIDAGPLLAQSEVEVAPGESLLRVTVGLYERAAETILEALAALARGAPARPLAEGAYQSWPDRAVVRRLHAQGRRLMVAGDLAWLLRRGCAGR